MLTVLLVVLLVVLLELVLWELLTKDGLRGALGLVVSREARFWRLARYSDLCLQVARWRVAWDAFVLWCPQNLQACFGVSAGKGMPRCISKARMGSSLSLHTDTCLLRCALNPRPHHRQRLGPLGGSICPLGGSIRPLGSQGLFLLRCLCNLHFCPKSLQQILQTVIRVYTDNIFYVSFYSYYTQQKQQKQQITKV